MQLVPTRRPSTAFLLMPLTLLTPLFLGSCGHDDDDDDGGGGGPPGTGVLCDGAVDYLLDGVLQTADSANPNELGVCTVDFANSVVQIQANVNAGATSTSLVLLFNGVPGPGPATYTPLTVTYNIIDNGTGLPTESYLTITPTDFDTTFTQLDEMGATWSFTGGSLTGGPIGGAPGTVDVTNGSGDHQVCN
ncbi:MAG: hypothetical protein AAF682_13305 [Planctomycetota bacterium]